MSAEVFGGNGSGGLLGELWFILLYFFYLVIRRRSERDEYQVSPLGRHYLFWVSLLWVKYALDTCSLWMLTATVFLSFGQHENMVTASAELIGAVCRHLSWSAYLYHLKHFIHVLQTGQISPKLGVRWVLWAMPLKVSPKTAKAKFSAPKERHMDFSLFPGMRDCQLWGGLMQVKVHRPCRLQVWRNNRSLLSHAVSHWVHARISSFCFCQTVLAPGTPTLLQHHCMGGFTVSQVTECI